MDRPSWSQSRADNDRVDKGTEQGQRWARRLLYCSSSPVSSNVGQWVELIFCSLFPALNISCLHLPGGRRQESWRISSGSTYSPSYSPSSNVTFSTREWNLEGIPVILYSITCLLQISLSSLVSIKNAPASPSLALHKRQKSQRGIYFGEEGMTLTDIYIWYSPILRIASIFKRFLGCFPVQGICSSLHPISSR